MRRIAPLFVIALLAIAACTDDAKPSGQTSSSSASAGPDARTIAELELQGDGALATSINTPSVRCQFPDINGRSIAVLVTLNDGSTVRLSVYSREIVAKVSKGSGSDYAERDFKGEGVASFDAVAGGRINAQLTEVPVAGGANKGDVGALTAIKGTVNCGNQKPGRSTVSFTGDLGDTTFSHIGLDDPRVECSTAGQEVILLGVLRTESTKALAEVGLRDDGVTVSLFDANGAERRFTGPKTSVKPDAGGYMDVDVLEQAAESPLHRMHLEGDVTCGTPVG